VSAPAHFNDPKLKPDFWLLVFDGEWPRLPSASPKETKAGRRADRR
jgi:hypothetical protein